MKDDLLSIKRDLSDLREEVRNEIDQMKKSLLAEMKNLLKDHVTPRGKGRFNIT